MKKRIGGTVARTIRSSGSFQPFGALSSLLDKAPKGPDPRDEKPFEPGPVEKQALQRWTANASDPHPDPQAEQRLFADAMADVLPLARANRADHHGPLAQPDSRQEDPDAECRRLLENLVNWGQGFVVEQTPEYIQGTGPGTHPYLARRLHRGDFSIQAHVDLHGLGADQAQQVLESFFRQCLTQGKRAVLVVHGRGRCSSGEPVLKTMFHRWLTAGPWRKQVLAFASARSFDGGTGATYVLLRRKPLTNRMVKKGDGR